MRSRARSSSRPTTDRRRTVAARPLNLPVAPNARGVNVEWSTKVRAPPATGYGDYYFIAPWFQARSPETRAGTPTIPLGAESSPLRRLQWPHRAHRIRGGRHGCSPIRCHRPRSLAPRPRHGQRRPHHHAAGFREDCTLRLAASPDIRPDAASASNRRPASAALLGRGPIWRNSTSQRWPPAALWR